MFLDSDDILANRSIEFAQKEMMETNANVLMGDFYRETAEKQFIKMVDKSTWLHGKVYKRAFLEENNIRFSKGYNEDGAFNTQCYMLSDAVHELSYPMYFWMNNHNSITRSEELFAFKYAPDLISTLNEAYLNIFTHSEKNMKILNNLGIHCALFYSFMNKLLTLDTEWKEDSFNKCEKEIYLFSKNNIDILSDEEKKYLKKGFAFGYLKHASSPFLLELNAFCNKYFNFGDINAEDFTELK